MATKPMTDEEFDRRLNVSFFVGQASALEDFSKFLLSEAGQLYSRDRDREAELYRQIAKTAGEHAAKFRQMQKQEEAGSQVRP